MTLERLGNPGSKYQFDPNQKWEPASPPAPTVPATAAVAGLRGGSRWVGRVAAEASLPKRAVLPVPVGPPGARRHERVPAGSRARYLDLAVIPTAPADANAPPIAVRSQPGPKPRTGSFRFEAANGFSPSAKLEAKQAPLVLRRARPKQAPIVSLGIASGPGPRLCLSVQDRSEPRSIAACRARANPASTRFGLRPRRTQVFRREDVQAEAFTSPFAVPERSELRSDPPPDRKRGDSRLRPDVAAPWRPRAIPALPDGFVKSGLTSACADAGPASSAAPPLALHRLLLRGKSVPPPAASVRNPVRFRSLHPFLHASKAVMDCESRQADSACG